MIKSVDQIMSQRPCEWFSRELVRTIDAILEAGLKKEESGE